MSTAAAREYSEQLKKFLEEELLEGDGTDEGLDAPGSLSGGGVIGVDVLGTQDGSRDLEAELEEFRDHEVIKGILDQGVELTEYAKQVEDRLRHVELESIQDYIQESDNLVSLHEQVMAWDDNFCGLCAAVSAQSVSWTRMLSPLCGMNGQFWSFLELQS